MRNISFFNANSKLTKIYSVVSMGMLFLMVQLQIHMEYIKNVDNDEKQPEEDNSQWMNFFGTVDEGMKFRHFMVI